jgi:anti-sigma B factor antagonist
MTLQQRTSGPIEILTLAGRLTLGDGCSSLREAVRKIAERKADLLVDLAGVNYIDSAGLGELVACFNSVTAAGREMKLLRPGKRVDSMLHITKLYSTFDIYEEEAPALAGFTVRS